MNTSPKRVQTDANNRWVQLTDGRTLGVPLVWFPHLLAATPQERGDCALSARGIHWDALDEDISVEGLLARQGDHTCRRREVA